MTSETFLKHSIVTVMLILCSVIISLPRSSECLYLRAGIAKPLGKHQCHRLICSSTYTSHSTSSGKAVERFIPPAVSAGVSSTPISQPLKCLGLFGGQGFLAGKMSRINRQIKRAHSQILIALAV